MCIIYLGQKREDPMEWNETNSRVACGPKLYTFATIFTDKSIICITGRKSGMSALYAKIKPYS